MSEESIYNLKEHRCENCGFATAVPISSWMLCSVDSKKPAVKRVCWWTCKKWNQKKVESKDKVIR